MSQISTEIGKQIRTFRKKRKMTLEALAAVICKSKSTVSKYENGEIPVDIETLYEIASALQIHSCSTVRHAMPTCRTAKTVPPFSQAAPSFMPMYMTEEISS